MIITYIDYRRNNHRRLRDGGSCQSIAMQITFDDVFSKNENAITTFTGCAVVAVVFTIIFVNLNMI